MQTEIRRIKSNTFFYIPFIGTCGRHTFLRKDMHIKGARFKKCGQTEQTVILIKKTHTLIRRDYGGVTQMTMTYKAKQKYLISFISCLLCERTDPSSPPLLPPSPIPPLHLPTLELTVSCPNAKAFPLPSYHHHDSLELSM